MINNYYNARWCAGTVGDGGEGAWTWMERKACGHRGRACELQFYPTGCSPACLDRGVIFDVATLACSFNKVQIAFVHIRRMLQTSMIASIGPLTAGRKQGLTWRSPIRSILSAVEKLTLFRRLLDLCLLNLSIGESPILPDVADSPWSMSAL